ncbi:MAG: YqhA family protein, partial [Gammaproteobacteria bacterium]
MLERFFENGLWSSRFIVLLAVIFGLIGAIVLFIVASADIFATAKYVISTYVAHGHPEHFHEDVVGGIIGAVDLYLIGVVMLLFSFGLYELFISEIDAAKDKAG